MRRTASRSRSPRVTERRSHGARDRDLEHARARSRSRSPASRKRRRLQHDVDDAGSSRNHRSRPGHDSRVKSEEKSRSLRSEHAAAEKHQGVNPQLPFSARRLYKSEMEAWKPLFAEYLSLQKRKDIDDMDEREIRGRWKSFIAKWNSGVLAEGWYDPEMYARIKERNTEQGYESKQHLHQPDDKETKPHRRSVERNDEVLKRDMPEVSDDDGSDDDDDDDDDAGYGPKPLGTSSENHQRAYGVGAPSMQDLSLRREAEQEEQQNSTAALRLARRADRAEQKERLDDLTPRAEAGTRERMLEKRAMVNQKMREFRDKSPDGGGMVTDDRDLMGGGGGGDSLAEYKAMKASEQRKKTERELRREEMARARREEMEERRRLWREREEGTVGMLRELARQRFG